jgi:hypothetical protein
VTTLEFVVRFVWIAGRKPTSDLPVQVGRSTEEMVRRLTGPGVVMADARKLVVRPPWNAMFVLRALRTKSHIVAVSSGWAVH